MLRSKGIKTVVLGGFLPQDRFPQAYNLFRFLSKAFIALIKGLIVPLLFSTIVVGIAQTGDIKAIGRNLTDERYRIASQNVAGLWLNSNFGAPRYYGLELGFSFRGL